MLYLATTISRTYHAKQHIANAVQHSSIQSVHIASLPPPPLLSRSKICRQSGGKRCARSRRLAYAAEASLHESKVK